ncbi:LysR family transcriptional regulator [Mycolicibacterium baixiangningiae]|uniref:LysR family transcriptional regulator n=1 Tax=Mycolicibacterium baixiangningiae TaxID=2761578 RepID=UPI001868461C|nr:LysR family transcriptional regulator [Mycolicibacterium baixiangningiae]
MDLVRHLQYFVAVAEHRHFGRAATTLGLTQPPVSQGLRRLETHLGLRLIERARDGAMVTAEGAALLPRARLIIEDSRRFLDDAADLLGALHVLRWGATPQLDDEVVARCVDGLRRAMTPAGAPVRTVTADTVQLVSDVRRGVLQLAVVEHPTLVDGVIAGPVVTLNRSVVLPAGHRAAKAKSPRAQMLSDLELATVPREANPAGYDLLLDSLRRRGLDVVIRPAATHRDVSAAVASGGCFGMATGGAPVHTGTVHRRMLVDEVAMRVRIVATAGLDLDHLVYAVDRELLRASR